MIDFVYVQINYNQMCYLKCKTFYIYSVLCSKDEYHFNKLNKSELSASMPIHTQHAYALDNADL